MFDLNKLALACENEECVYVPQELWIPFMQACEALNIKWCTGAEATRVADAAWQQSRTEGLTIHLKSRFGGMAQSLGYDDATIHCFALMTDPTAQPHVTADSLLSLLSTGGMS